MNQLSDKVKGIIYASITALLWGFLAIALKVSLEDLPPVSVVWFRFTFAFVLLALYFLITSRKQFGIFRKPPFILIVAGVMLGLNYLGFISGVHYTSPSNAQVFIQLGPVLFALSGIIIYREKVTWQNIAGFILVLGGLTLFYSEQIGQMLVVDRFYNRGIAWVIFGAVAWSVFATFQKKLVQSFSTGQLNMFIYGLCALLFLPFVDFDALPGLSWGMWLLLVFLGLNTLVAYGSLAMAIKYLEANKVSVIITLNPIITFITMAILGEMQVSWIAYEHFSAAGVAGAITVLSGALLVILFSGRKSKGVKKKGEIKVQPEK
ncbi:MAG TPA: DMT family transporter [Bacteroidales bacterium]|nr:DMT family transporter [Bacteroidales bacterium]